MIISYYGWYNFRKINEGGNIVSELDDFEAELDYYLEMTEDWNLKPEDYYKEFTNRCINYNSESVVPYSVCAAFLDEDMPCEEYYMQMLMDVYSFYNVGDDFLELLQRMLDEGYCDEYQKKTQELIKDYIQDGYIIAYRGEFATEKHGNLDYTKSVSYSLDYEEAKFFATRFKALPLTKSVVYTVKVPVNEVLAYIEREDEVVCLPICMGGHMKVIKEESML